jgi:hypothetical protein
LDGMGGGGGGTDPAFCNLFNSAVENPKAGAL